MPQSIGQLILEKGPRKRVPGKQILEMRSVTIQFLRHLGSGTGSHRTSAQTTSNLIGLKAPGNYSAPLVLYILRFAYGRNQNSSFLWFRDLWTRPRAPKSIMLIFWNTRIPQTNQENPETFSKIVFLWISKDWNYTNSSMLQKTGAE